MRASTRVVLFALLLLAPGIGAQETISGDAAEALARIAPGSTLRVQTRAGEVLQGTFRLADDSLLLETDVGGRAIALSDVRSAWYQQRRTRSGAITGSLIGAGGAGAFLGLFVAALGGTGGETVAAAAIGLLGGAAGGGLLGGVVGAALPRWTLAYAARAEDREAVPAVPAAPASDDVRTGRRRLGSLEVAPGYGRIGGGEPTSGGWGARLALHADFGVDPATPRGTTAYLSLGPEAGWFNLGRTDLVRRDFGRGNTAEFSRRYSALTAGGVVRGGLAARPARGYALVGLAYNRWEIDQRDERWISQGPDSFGEIPGQSTFEHIGYTIGVGAHATVAPRGAVGLELRRTAVGTFDFDLPGSYWSLTATLVRRW